MGGPRAARVGGGRALVPRSMTLPPQTRCEQVDERSARHTPAPIEDAQSRLHQRSCSERLPERRTLGGRHPNVPAAVAMTRDEDRVRASSRRGSADRCDGSRTTR